MIMPERASSPLGRHADLKHLLRYLQMLFIKLQQRTGRIACADNSVNVFIIFYLVVPLTAKRSHKALSKFPGAATSPSILSALSAQEIASASRDAFLNDCR